MDSLITACRYGISFASLFVTGREILPAPMPSAISSFSFLYTAGDDKMCMNKPCMTVMVVSVPAGIRMERSNSHSSGLCPRLIHSV